MDLTSLTRSYTGIDAKFTLAATGSSNMTGLQIK